MHTSEDLNGDPGAVLAIVPQEYSDVFTGSRHGFEAIFAIQMLNYACLVLANGDDIEILGLSGPTHRGNRTTAEHAVLYAMLCENPPNSNRGVVQSALAHVSNLRSGYGGEIGLNERWGMQNERAEQEDGWRFVWHDKQLKGPSI